ncbi:sensor domain-containing protein [Mycobacterium sp. NPDC050441]|uniref:sensor domain-containing protein n=1 Tax=Mycobacterium sp. NPDC050441 TaxID=3155403 RepID=UPI0033C85291
MSFGGYGGPPSDPFGGAPFGGWSGPPSGPPTIQVPPPPSQETNQLATLSIVFAFLFAPAGAVLGHVALSQIKRLHQKGRDRAIIGLVLSYVVIVIAVAALVVWLVIPRSDTATSSRPTLPAGPTDQQSVQQYLLTKPEVDRAMQSNYQLMSALTDSNGGLRRANVTSDAPDCAGVPFAAQKSSYDSAQEQAFAGSVWRWGPKMGPAMFVIQNVIALPDVTSAQTLFDEFSDIWKRCEGKTVNESVSDPKLNSTRTINEVRATPETLLAFIDNENNLDHAVDSYKRVTRAIGLHRNYLVDLEIRGWRDKETEQTVDGRTSDVLDAILDKIG